MKYKACFLRKIRKKKERKRKKDGRFVVDRISPESARVKQQLVSSEAIMLP